MDAEIAIIGGGVMGLAAAWRLALTGRAVVLLERFGPGHDRASSHGATRIFRFAYDDPTYVRMAQRALPLWRELDPTLVTLTGGLDVGNRSYLRACADALRACGATVETELADRFPWLETGGQPVLYSPDTGVIAAARTLETLTARASEHGAEIRYQARADALDEDEDGVTVRTSTGDLRARTAIVAAGPWTSDLVSDLPLTVTREQVFFFDVPHDTVPVIDRTQSTPVYVVPALHGAPGVKVAEHHAGAPTTGDARSFEPDPDGERRLRAWVSARLAHATERPVAFETCLYTNTPDEHFVIERRGRIVISSTCSGHGFKFAPLIGEALAALATDREPPFDLARFSSARFR